MKKMKKSVALLALALGITTAGIIATNNTATQTANGGLKGTYDFTAFAEGTETYTAYATKGLVSTDGSYLLLLTGIDDVTAYKEIGYKISVNGGAVTTERMTTYYTSVKTGETEVGQTTIFDADVQGMIVYEIAYDSANEYSVTPYFTKNDGTEINGTQKTADAEFATPILDACTVVSTVSNVKINTINSEKVKYMDQTTTGTSGTPVFVTTEDKNGATAEGVYFSKEKAEVGQHSEFRFTFPAMKVTKVTFDYKTTNSNTGTHMAGDLNDTTLVQVKTTGNSYVAVIENNLTADGEWHTATIEYVGEITDVIVKMYQFQGEIVVANINTYNTATVAKTVDFGFNTSGQPTATNVALDLTDVATTLGTVTEVKYGETDVTANATTTGGTVTLPLSLFNGGKDYGEKTFTVKANNGVTEYDVTVNAKLVTKVISTKADLDNMGTIAKAFEGTNNWDGYFMLGSNVAYNGVYAGMFGSAATWASNSANRGFKGVFDGNGYVIDGLEIVKNTTDGACSGFIPTLMATGVIKNVAFTNASVTDCGYITSNCASTATYTNIYVQYKALIGNTADTATFNPTGNTTTNARYVFIDGSQLETYTNSTNNWARARFMDRKASDNGGTFINPYCYGVGNAVTTTADNKLATSESTKIVAMDVDTFKATWDYQNGIKSWDLSFWDISTGLPLPKALANK